MAVFIPEWSRVPARMLHVRRALAELDDTFVVRRPLRAGAGGPDFFVQHPVHGWLAVDVEAAPYAAVDAAQLFESDEKQRFVRRLERLRALGGDVPAGTKPTLPALVVMWSCDAAEVKSLSAAYLERHGVRLMSRATFESQGAKAVQSLLAPTHRDAEHALLGTHFPEAEIALACTERRAFYRDNRARLERFFLDVDQEWAAKLDLDLPGDELDTAKDLSIRLVNGVAGSGKTLIALHRALLLAELFPTQRVLLLIHNTPVVADLEQRLHRAGRKVPDNLELTTFFAWATRQWRHAFGMQPTMPEPGVVPDHIRRHAARGDGLRVDDAQLAAEFDFINETMIVDEAGYLEAARTGRGFALGPADRKRVWAQYEAVTQSLHRAGLRLWSAIPHDVVLARDAHARIERAHHLLVDEAQFFAPAWFELVKLALRPSAGHGSLFLCADPNQGFMRHRTSWKRVGLDVAGRTKKLRRSYRTTRAILETAGRVLDELRAGDGTAAADSADDFLRPDFDGMDDGVAPLLVYTDSPQDSIDRLVNELVAAAGPGGVPLHRLLVVAGDRVNRRGLYERLNKVFDGAVWWFNEKSQKRMPPQGRDADMLRMAYLDTATGLEASIVFLVGIESVMRDDRVGSARVTASATVDREERLRKLYMAMTRAAQRLVLLSCETLPPRLEALFERDGPRDDQASRPVHTG